jgi:hypothetical protein
MDKSEASKTAIYGQRMRGPRRPAATPNCDEAHRQGGFGSEDAELAAEWVSAGRIGYT